MPNTERQSAYYSRIRKLTPEQRQEALQLYMSHPLTATSTRPQRLTISALAKSYKVSTSAMFRAIHEELYNLEQASQADSQS